MGNLEHISAYQKIPVFVFLENNLLQGSQEIMFLTLDASSLFECIRFYMNATVDALKKKTTVSFSFETRLYSPNEINKIAQDIDKRRKEKTQQPLK